MDTQMDTETKSDPHRADAEASAMSAAVDGLRRLLGGHRTLAAARGISQAALDSIYGVARELYVSGHYAEALRSFEMLCLYDHENARNWHALGVCRQVMADYSGAAEALVFATGQLAEPDHALQVNLTECLIAAEALDAAENVLGPLAAAAREGALDEPSSGKVRVLESRLGQLRTGTEPPLPDIPGTDTGGVDHD